MDGTARLICGLLLTAALVACGSDEESEPTGTAAAAPTTAPAASTTGAPAATLAPATAATEAAATTTVVIVAPGGGYGPYGEAPATTAPRTDPTDPPQTDPPATEPAAAADAVVEVGSVAAGEVLTSEGRTLYAFTSDESARTPTCTGGCAEAWPPLIVPSDEVVVGGGLDSSLFGTVARDDGSLQVTVDSWPLYWFASDLAPGDANGQGVGGVWFVVGPDGVLIRD